MNPVLRALASLLLPVLLFLGCGDDAAPSGSDAGSDAGSVEDGGGSDAALADAGDLDAGPADGGGDIDAGGDSDAGPPDAGPIDAGYGSDCSDDDECSDGWCRARMTTGRECVPFVGEGESCGGFRPPWAFERCVPDFGCIEPNPRLADGPGVCATAVTVAELVANPSTYDGRVVAVLDGWVDARTPACTRIACPMTNPCCNTCNALEALFDSDSGGPSVALENDEGESYGCTGNECDPIAVCTVPAQRGFRVIGRFDGDPSGHTIEVRTIEQTFSRF